ncbi:hypothetical protein E7Z59_03235 [Robertkochia marina]|uniref:Uncharacterized protein n=1 Tax=Robertkochia marina TaxID=1227945 RepID=A0A4S3M2R9_9FLAO|nr:DUF6168 family protein [Robertkochia marina]THD69353.1 hypothetical protein E7Z59_03235 [Robertkochia marina]
MRSKIHPLFWMIFWFLLFILGAYFIHELTLELNAIRPAQVLLDHAYLANALLAVLILVIIYWLRKKYFSQIGFLFLAGSMLKFAVFFIWFSPAYKADGILSKAEFIGFFIPYFISLVFESLAVYRLLNSKPDTDS